LGTPASTPASAAPNLSHLPHERQTQIAELVQARGAVSGRELRAIYGVSELTIRRDLDHLAAAGKLRRTRGGAVRIHSEAPGDGSLLSEGRVAISEWVDVLVLTPASPKSAQILQRRAMHAGIPIISEAHPLDGAVTLVSVDNHHAGLELGRWTGHSMRQAGLPVRGLTISVSLENAEARRLGFCQGLLEAHPEAKILLNVFGEGMREPTRKLVSDVLTVHPEINLFFAINDAMLDGAFDAYRGAGLPERDLVAVVIGLEGREGLRQLSHEGPCRAGVAMLPDVVGKTCVDAAVCAHAGLPLPPRIITPAPLVTSETLGRYYAPGADGELQIRWDAVDALWSPDSGHDALLAVPPARRPRRIGFVYSFGTHEWYQNVRRAMDVRCRELGIELITADASENLVLEKEQLKLDVARVAAACIEDGDTVILDSGSTMTLLAKQLLQRRNLTVITNSVDALSILSENPNITLLSTGGMVHQRSRALVGPATVATLASLRVDKAFLSASGVSFPAGIYAPNAEEAAVKQAMIRCAREAFLVVDHTKIGEEFMTWFASLASVNTLVTDEALPARDRLMLNQAGIKVRTQPAVSATD
jgi:DeoR/GlpR family transcriptional regulator of sugar metabolism